jgi:hypothetical protein
MYDSSRADNEPQQCCVTKDKVALSPDRCPPLYDTIFCVHSDIQKKKKLLDIEKGLQVQIPEADSTSRCIPEKTSAVKGIVAIVVRGVLPTLTDIDCRR